MYTVHIVVFTVLSSVLVRTKYVLTVYTRADFLCDKITFLKRIFSRFQMTSCGRQYDIHTIVKRIRSQKNMVPNLIFSRNWNRETWTFASLPKSAANWQYQQSQNSLNHETFSDSIFPEAMSSSSPIRATNSTILVVPDHEKPES
jgi:hypothetical protein